MSEKNENKFLENLFLEIKDGFSEIRHKHNNIYIKHASLNELKIQNEYYQKFFDKAKGMGVPTDSELAKTLEDNESWTKQEESKYQSLKIEIKNLRKTLENLFTEQEKKSISKRIDEVDKELKSEEKKRSSLFTSSAENYAERKSTESFIRHCFFKDSDCKVFLFTKEEFEEINTIELGELYNVYNKHSEKFSEKNLQKISINSIFKSIYNLFSKDISNFFNKHPFDLTFYQVNLLNYGKLFDSIIRNNDLPKNILDDPQKILEHINEKEKLRKRNIEEKSRSSDGFSYAKAKDQDLEKMGVSKKGTKDIHAIAEESGGELSMEDFMKIHKK